MNKEEREAYQKEIFELFNSDRIHKVQATIVAYDYDVAMVKTFKIDVEGKYIAIDDEGTIHLLDVDLVKFDYDRSVR